MIKLLFFAMLSLSLVSCDRPSSAGQADVSSEASVLRIVSADGKTHDFNIEIALTREEQARGLMNRTEMAADHGMLFWFGQPQETAFWMKNTLIPLDMIFIRQDGKIGKIKDSATPLDLTGIPSDGPIVAVLELNGGTAKRLGIVPGDAVKHLLLAK